MPRKTKEDPCQLALLEARVATAPCVAGIRQKVNEWRGFELKPGMKLEWPRGGYRGVTATTEALLKHWFYTDHLKPDGSKFRYH